MGIKGVESKRAAIRSSYIAAANVGNFFSMIRPSDRRLNEVKARISTLENLL